MRNKDPKTSLPIFEFHKESFPIPKELEPYITDWSYSNMSAMWRVGYERGKQFCETDLGKRLLKHHLAGVEPAAPAQGIRGAP